MKEIKAENKVISLLMTVLFVLAIVATPLFTYASSSADYASSEGFEIYLVASPGVTASLTAQVETTDRNNMGADAAAFNEYSSIYKCYTLTITSEHAAEDIRYVSLSGDNAEAYVYNESYDWIGLGGDNLPLADKYYLSNGQLTKAIVNTNPGGNGGSSSSGSKSSSGGRSGDSSSSTVSSTPTPVTQTSSNVKDLAMTAKSNGDNMARSKGAGEVTIKGSAWAQLSGLSFQHDTVSNGTIQVRITIDNPTALKQDIKVSGYTTGPDVDRVGNFFNKHFNNTTSVMHLDQTGSWGQEIRIAAKFDLTGMNKNNLVFYSYDKTTNSYKQIKDPKYSIDSNGYTHFSTQYAGDIIVSDGPLSKK